MPSVTSKTIERVEQILAEEDEWLSAWKVKERLDEEGWGTKVEYVKLALDKLENWDQVKSKEGDPVNIPHVDDYKVYKEA